VGQGKSCEKVTKKKTFYLKVAKFLFNPRVVMYRTVPMRTLCDCKVYRLYVMYCMSPRLYLPPPPLLQLTQW
jgi:hypothetical protein